MITLKNFLEKFVGHNSEIILFDEEKDLQYRKEAQKNKEKFYKLEILWQGMDWEATDAEHEYFKIHTDVVPCPYINSRVVRVFPYDTDIVPILGIEIDVDWDDYEKQIKARNDFEVKLKGAKMKAVLLSVKPKWCKLIFSGEKTIEVGLGEFKQMKISFYY